MQAVDCQNAKRGQAGLYLVRDHSWDGRAGQSPIDIVAIHGINGHCIETWKHDKSGMFWLRDQLPDKLPHARIMTFQYEANVLGNRNAYGIRDAATQLLRSLEKERAGHCQDRPIVFVAHSLGGIITKEALFVAKIGAVQSTENIYEMTKGIVFFGTPHRGSNAADWATIASKLASPMPFQKASKFLEALQLHSDQLRSTAENFRDLATQYAITTFYEQDVHPLTGNLIVDKQSAIMGVVHEDILMLNGNHQTMCRFAKGDPRFDTAWWYIKRAAKGPPKLRREGRRTTRQRLKDARKGEKGEGSESL